VTVSLSLQFIVPTSDLHGGIRLPLELAEWLGDSGWVTRVVGPGSRPDWHDVAVPWFSADLDGSSIPRADVTIATFHTTVGPALRSKSDHLFHLCQGYEGSHPEYGEIMAAIDTAYRAPIPKLLVSRHLETVLAEHYPDIRCHFIGEAVDPRIFFQLGFRETATPLRVGLVGTFSARVKGIRDGLEGLAIARKRGLALEVHRVSTEPMQDEETALGMSDVFHHRLPTLKMPEFYAGIDVLLFPSTAEEGFGLPVLEAMSCGVPVAHSDIPSLDVIPDNASLRFAPGDPEAIADAMTQLVGAGPRHALRTKALLTVEDYRPHVLVGKLEDALGREGCALP
jgi:glycosyltransferase involved in cell wall biosynthesis